jgi:hypothetical protein
VVTAKVKTFHAVSGMWRPLGVNATAVGQLENSTSSWCFSLRSRSYTKESPYACDRVDLVPVSMKCVLHEPADDAHVGTDGRQNHVIHIALTGGFRFRL